MRSYYAKPGHSAGGNCHVVLDDNSSLSHVQWTLAYCEDAKDKDGIEIMRALLQMTETQRRKVCRCH